MARTTPVSKGCTTLLRPLGMILPGAEAIMSTLPRLAQASSLQKTVIRISAMARPIGEGGVSTISSAAGRNAVPSAGRSRRDPHPSLPRERGRVREGVNDPVERRGRAYSHPTSSWIPDCKRWSDA